MMNGVVESMRRIVKDCEKHSTKVEEEPTTHVHRKSMIVVFKHHAEAQDILQISCPQAPATLKEDDVPGERVGAKNIAIILHESNITKAKPLDLFLTSRYNAKNTYNQYEDHTSGTRLAAQIQHSSLRWGNMN